MRFLRYTPYGLALLPSLLLTLALGLLFFGPARATGAPVELRVRFGLMAVALALLTTALAAVAGALGDRLLRSQVERLVAEARTGLLAEVTAQRQEAEALRQAVEEEIADRTVALRRRNADLATSRATQFAVMESLTSGLVLVAPDGRIRYINRQTEALLSLTRSIHPGRRAAELYEAVAEATVDPALALAEIRRASSEPGYRPILLIRSPAGRPRSLRWITFPIRGTAGASLGHGHTLIDVTREAELDRLKSELISTVSHELRTPLTVVRASADSLLRPDVAWDEETKHEFITAIAEESARLQALVANLLDLSKIEAGVLQLVREPESVAALLGRVIDRSRLRFPGWQIDLDLPAGLPWLPVDRLRLEQALFNLIENAVKYSDDSRVVRLWALQAGPEVRIAVQDEGIGIPPEQLGQIFERFHRVDNSLSRQTGGSGIGLAICRGVIEAHGGRIWAERNEGPGVTFWMALPIGEGGIEAEDEGAGGGG